MSIHNIGNLSSQVVSRQGYSVSSYDRTDVFEFSINNTDRNIGLNLHGLTGDADLTLYFDSNYNGVLDSSDDYVTSSSLGGTDSDVIDYSVLDRGGSTGTYFAEVSYYNNVSGGPVYYDLDMTAAYDVGELSSSPISKTNFSVTATDSTDVFEFDIAANQNINLNLHNISANGDADLSLYEDNGNGIFDADDTFITSSTNGGNANDVINELSITGGTFFAQVERYHPGSNGDVTYSLDLSATNNRVALSETPFSQDALTLNEAQPSNLFEFDVAASQSIHLNLHNISANDDVDLRLYQDNGNGFFDDTDLLVASSANGGNQDDLIDYRAELGGTFFAEVERYSFDLDGEATYDLDASATYGNSSNLVGGEIDLTPGTDLSYDIARYGSVDSTDLVDSYAVSLGLYSGVNFSLSGLTADADIRLIQDTNNNGIVDLGEQISSSTLGQTSSESISGIENSGDYVLQVYQYGPTGTSYNLTVDHYSTPYA